MFDHIFFLIFTLCLSFLICKYENRIVVRAVLKRGEQEKKHLELYLALTQQVSAVMTGPTCPCGHSASSGPGLSNRSFCDDGNILSSVLQQAS